MSPMLSDTLTEADVADCVIHRAEFLKRFNLPGDSDFAGQLFDFFVAEIPTDMHASSEIVKSNVSRVVLPFDGFRNGIAKCTRLRGEQRIRTLFCICVGSSAPGKINCSQLERFFSLSFLLALNASKLAMGLPLLDKEESDITVGKKLAVAALRLKSAIDLATLTTWIFNTIPDVGKTLAAYISVRCLLPPFSRSSVTSDYRDSFDMISEKKLLPSWVFNMPQLDCASSILSRDDIFSLALVSNQLQCKWNLLYCSNSDGMSFNRLYKAVHGYKGPTLVVVRDTSGFQFGAFADNGDEGWREENVFYGLPNSFLYAVAPKFRIFRSSRSALAGSNFMYLNSQGFSLPHGMGFGGEIEGKEFRLWIPEDFDGCRALSFDDTYERGNLASSEHGFTIDTIECWGLGGNKALQGREELRAANQSMRNRILKVDKKALIGTDFDREMFFGKTFNAHKGPSQLQEKNRGCGREINSDSD
eukprot:g4286.t1